jgi:hypothetical protein
MPEEQKPPVVSSELAEQLAKLIPPALIERLNTLPPHIREQIEKAAPTLSSLLATRANDYKSSYSDLYRTRMGANGVTLLFARMTHSPSLLAMSDRFEEEAEVTMGWSQIKMLSITLGEIVRAFEDEIGAILIPTAFQPNLDGQRQAMRNLGLPLRVGAASADAQRPPDAKRGSARRRPT